MRKIPLCLPARLRAALCRPRLAALVVVPLLAAALALLDGGIIPMPGSPFVPGAAQLGQIPAAEAWGREFRRGWESVRNASDVSDAELGDTVNDDAGRCTMEIDLSGWSPNGRNGRGVHKDWFCYSYTDRAIVTLTVDNDAKAYRAYASTGRAVPADAQGWHPNIQTKDSRNRELGRAGLAEYNGVLSSDANDANHERRIVLTRDMAPPNHLLGANYHSNRNHGTVFITVYVDDPGGGDGLDNLNDKIDANGAMASLRGDQDFVIQIYFLHEIGIGDTWVFFPSPPLRTDDGRLDYKDWRWRNTLTPRISAAGYYKPNPAGAPRATLDRRLVLNDYWQTGDRRNLLGGAGNSIGRGTGGDARSGIKYCIQHRDFVGAGYWHPGAETTIKLVFAPGSNFTDASGEYEETKLERHFHVAGGGCDYRYLTGFNPDGPVRAEMQVTINDGQGNIGDMEPFTIIIEGKPARLYLTRTPTTRLSGGARYVQMQYALTDALGSPLTGSRARIRWQGADDRSRAVIDRNGGGGSAAGGRFSFPITDDAAAGFYNLTLTAGDISRQVAFRVYDLPPLPPAQMVPARITASAVGGGSFTAGGRANFRYTLQDRNGNPISLSAHPVTWSTTASGILDEAGSVDGARQTDGRFGFDLADNPAPGVYTLTIRTAATDASGNPLASVQITFRIIGNPASYAVAGPDRVSPGGYAVYTVTAADANGNLPNLGGDRSRVAVSVSRAGSGDDAAGVRLFHIHDGSLMLNRQGVGYFRLRADRDAAAGSVTLTATSADGAVTGVKTVAIGTAAAP